MKYSITLLRYHLFVLLPSFSQRNNIYSSHRELDSSHGCEPGPEARSAMLRLFLWVRIRMIASMWRAITDTIGFATDSVGVSVLLLPKLTKEVSFHRDCAKLDLANFLFCPLSHLTAHSFSPHAGGPIHVSYEEFSVMGRETVRTPLLFCSPYTHVNTTSQPDYQHI